MAKVNFGAGILDARGKLGGMVYSANQSGAYIRRKASPTGSPTEAQSRVRANFGANAKLWSGTFTDAQRAAWTFFAAANPRTDVFGNALKLSGMSMAQALNQVLAQVGAAAISDPPTDLSVPTLATPLSMTADAATGAIAITTTTQSTTAGAKFYIFGTGGLAAGKVAQKTDFRFIEAVASAASGTSIAITTAYTNVFGIPASGSRVSMLVGTVNTDSGAVTPGILITAIAA